MGHITFIEYDGTQHDVELEAGKSLMQIAMDNQVPGIDADCGGNCACGTCHIIVEASWFSCTGEAGDNEKQMLEMTPEQTQTSRLACQVDATDTMDGMIVRLPEFQM